MRLFVAVNFPDALRRRIHRLAAPVREAGRPFRWVDPARIHLTLKFVGEVRRDRADAMAEEIRTIAAACRPFTLRFGAVGAFPSLRRPRVLWLGVEATPALRFLKDDLERGLARLGVPREDRPFQPHVTLARAERGAAAGAFRGLETESRGLSLDEERSVERIDLMESRLSPEGPEYEVVAAAPLGVGEEEA